jgi:hypothetical protein
MSGFDEALAVVLRFEGGYSDDPDDPGGATMRGITQRTYDAWRRRQGFPVRPVRTISDAEVRAIYREEYWQPAGCDTAPWPLALVLFDAAVQHGVRRALQLKHDDWQEFIWRRLDFYRRLPAARPQSLKFLPGWIWRMVQLRQAALAP